MPARRKTGEPDWSELRLKDRIAPGLRVLFVGVNPGVRSAITGHHFAGYSNRFWKLLSDSRLVPEPINYERDDELPSWKFGILFDCAAESGITISACGIHRRVEALERKSALQSWCSR
jgi:mismatch-specific thymine-DNA glycosylase